MLPLCAKALLAFASCGTERPESTELCSERRYSEAQKHVRRRDYARTIFNAITTAIFATGKIQLV
jgi:hypothetical protein